MQCCLRPFSDKLCHFYVCAMDAAAFLSLSVLLYAVYSPLLREQNRYSPKTLVAHSHCKLTFSSVYYELFQAHDSVFIWVDARFK